MARDNEDSLFWRVERACQALQYEVAASHARKGGSTVLMTNRKPRGAPALGVREISTKPQKASRVFEDFPLEREPRTPIPSREPPPLLTQRNPRICEECEGPCSPGAGRCGGCRGRGARAAEDGVQLRPGPEPTDVF